MFKMPEIEQVKVVRVRNAKGTVAVMEESKLPEDRASFTVEETLDCAKITFNKNSFYIPIIKMGVQS